MLSRYVVFCECYTVSLGIKETTRTMRVVDILSSLSKVLDITKCPVDLYSLSPDLARVAECKTI